MSPRHRPCSHHTVTPVTSSRSSRPPTAIHLPPPPPTFPTPLTITLHRTAGAGDAPTSFLLSANCGRESCRSWQRWSDRLGGVHLRLVPVICSRRSPIILWLSAGSQCPRISASITRRCLSSLAALHCVVAKQKTTALTRGGLLYYLWSIT